jgi:hypothetical protein
MDNKINKAVEAALESLESDGLAAPPKDGPPKLFEFNKTPDKVGLPSEHPAYVKPGCKFCYGRGYQAFLIGDGYNDETPRKKLEARRLQACVCVHKNYTQTRNSLEKLIAAAPKESEDPKVLADIAVSLIKEHFPGLLQ